jgi:hypothetical protein
VIETVTEGIITIIYIERTQGAQDPECLATPPPAPLYAEKLKLNLS